MPGRDSASTVTGWRLRLVTMLGVGPIEGLPASQVAIDARATRIDSLFFRRLVGLLKPYWWRWDAWPSWLMYGGALGFALINTALVAMTTKIVGNQTNALQARAQAEYWHQTMLMVGLAFLAFFVSTVIANNLSNLLRIHWEKWLTSRLIGIYLNNRTYYDISLHQDIDNPDQRIQSEVTTVVGTLSDLPRNIVMPIVSSIFQIGIVMSVSATMFWVSLVYAVTQTVATIYILRPQVAFQWKAAVAAADFRHNLVSIRENSETIAFYRGERSEQRNLGLRLDRSVRASRASLYYGLVVGAVNEVFSNLWTILPLLIVVPLYFAGKIPMGTIFETVMAAGIVVTNLSSLRDALPTLANVAPHIVRLSEIQERLEKVRRDQERDRTPRISYRVADDVTLDHVTIVTPDGAREVVRDLSVDLAGHPSTLIVGQTGVGKSSVLRAMAGLWTRGDGCISMPPPGEVMFLPQRPYMTLGSLRQQIVYPHLVTFDLTDEQIADVLDAVKLHGLLDRVGGSDTVRDWRQMLSLGEQQRLAFARVLVSRPRVVFLDESTSAVDVETERDLYTVLGQTVETYVSVGHRPTLLDYHGDVLRLRHDGWSFDATHLTKSAPAGPGCAILEM